jgi:phosphatidylinositol glycan class M
MKSTTSAGANTARTRDGEPRHPLWSWCERHPFFLGLSIRLFLAWCLPLLLDDARLIPGVAFTDVDFHVFSDAANHVAQGRSPYERHTYRYTPFLAALLSVLPKEGGRYLFCIADTLCGWIIMRLRRSSRTGDSNNASVPSLIDLLWWMYNPFAINICTRGSAESFMVLFPVLVTIMLVTTNSGAVPLLARACLAGVVHGAAVHSKLYPIIYSLSYMAYFATIQENRQQQVEEACVSSSSFPWTEPKRLWILIQTWIRRLLRPAPLLFLITFIASFTSLTYLAVLWYGEESLQEGLLYHLSRVDHRHNYSIFWYPIYLARARHGDGGMTLVGRALLIPQLVLLVYSSLGIAPHDLGLALFTQTYLFVTLNKVITAQYFTWYLCLLPLCHGFDYWKVKWSFLALGGSIVTWLASAYCLEMQGMSVHRLVWCASLCYFAANINLLGALLRSYTTQTTTPHYKSD